MATSLPLLLAGGPSDRAEYLLDVHEDDDNSFAEKAVAAVGAVAVVAVAAFVPGSVVVIGIPLTAAEGTGVLTGGLEAILAEDSSDDFIGQSGWAGTAADVSNRGSLTHDLDRATPVDPLPRFTAQDNELDPNSPMVSSHPSVDLFTHQFNNDVPNASCVDNTGCSSDRVCFIGVCVPQDWKDPTVAPIAPLIAGHTERRRFTGSGTDYRFYISDSISSENNKLQ